jgi:hypothetical protein
MYRNAFSSIDGLVFGELSRYLPVEGRNLIDVATIPTS